MFSSNTSQVSTAANWIEDCFSCFLYTGNGSTQTITNGIDLAGKGGLVWIKSRNNTYYNVLYDTARGVEKELISSATFASATQAGSVTAFNANGFSLGSYADANASSTTFASWTFREQPKFFDVVTYTGNGSNRTIAHSLGSVPGCIIVKRTDGNGGWFVYHRSLSNTEYLLLNTTAAKDTDTTYWNSTTPTSTTFSLGTGLGVNQNGATYVAYLFAHDAGGFGLTGTDNVISCGSFTTDGSGNATVNLGYEPQWFLRKRTDSTGSWTLVDNMRGFTADGTDAFLYPNLSNAEATSGGSERLTSTGVQITGFGASISFIYIAIRRGPMKTPTSGTSVFTPVAQNASSNAVVSTGFPVDLSISAQRDRTAWPFTAFIDRLRGSSTSSSAKLASQSTNAEANFTSSSGFGLDNNTAAIDGLWANLFGASSSISYYNLRRAPGFFDVVCFNGSNSDFTVNHNLQAIPELIILKRRNGTGSWFVGGTIVGFNASNNNNNLFLNNTNAISTATVYTATWTSTQMFMSGFANFVSGNTVVGYLFATCPGVSKVGSYTGNGSSQTLDMGFTGGARFFLVKRTDSTGDWWVYDSARGIVAANDPALALNNTNAEVTSADAVDATSVGLIVNQESTCNINVNGGTYIYLAIA